MRAALIYAVGDDGYRAMARREALKVMIGP
jgi:hypothetical protein